MLVLTAAVAGVGSWQLARSRAEVDRLREELRRAATQVGALGEDLAELRSDLRDLAEELRTDVPALLERVERSVVAVRIRGRAAASGLAVRARSLPKGYRTAILTPAWVARAAGRGPVLVVIHTGRSVGARPGKVDHQNGLGLLFIKTALPSWPWASTDETEPTVGEFVAAVGRSGRQIRATTGVITAIHPHVVRSDATFIPGSAGGPVLDRTGDVVGIIRGEPSGLVSAIPLEGACGKLVRC
jgi:S1-C subfamily serine protease